VHIKYDGTDTALNEAFGSVQEMTRDFEHAYLARYRFLIPERTRTVEAVTVEAWSGERILVTLSQAHCCNMAPRVTAG
jgi:5-oxoprolinase (ATP-hydrolysing)